MLCGFLADKNKNTGEYLIEVSTCRMIPHSSRDMIRIRVQ